MKVFCKSANSELLEKCGVYKLKCGSCCGVYLGKTGRSFKTRFKEHVSNIIYNKEKSGYSQHILTTGHVRAKDVNSLEVIEIQPKGQYLNTLERYYIYKHKEMGKIFN
jgi:hypothetical protein